MDPLDTPEPGMLRQTSENVAWMDDLEESFFTVPPATDRVVEDVEEQEDLEIAYTGPSVWPARLFVGACVGGVAAVVLGAILPLVMSVQPVRYPLVETITAVEVGEAIVVHRTHARPHKKRERKRSGVRSKVSIKAPVVSAATVSETRPPPMRVDSLPALSLAALQPGATL